MKQIAIDIKLFGAFRKFGKTLALKVPSGSSAGFVKEALSRMLKGGEAALVFDSALADDKKILPDDHILETDAALSILPPVCGG